MTRRLDGIRNIIAIVNVPITTMSGMIRHPKSGNTGIMIYPVTMATMDG